MRLERRFLLGNGKMGIGQHFQILSRILQFNSRKRAQSIHGLQCTTNPSVSSTLSGMCPVCTMIYPTPPPPFYPTSMKTIMLRRKSPKRPTKTNNLHTNELASCCRNRHSLRCESGALHCPGGNRSAGHRVCLHASAGARADSHASRQHR